MYIICVLNHINWYYIKGSVNIYPVLPESGNINTKTKNNNFATWWWKKHTGVFFIVRGQFGRSKVKNTFKKRLKSVRKAFVSIQEWKKTFRSTNNRSGVVFKWAIEKLKWKYQLSGVPGINILHISYLVLHLPQLPQEFLIEGQVQVRDSTCHQEAPRLVQGTRVQWAPPNKTVGPKMEKHRDLTNTLSGIERMKHPPNFWFILVLFPNEWTCPS